MSKIKAFWWMDNEYRLAFKIMLSIGFLLSCFFCGLIFLQPIIIGIVLFVGKT